MTIDYTNPFERFKVLAVVKDNVTVLPALLKKRNKKQNFENRLGGLGNVLETIAHAETKEIVTTDDGEIEIKSSDHLTSLLELALRKNEEILKLKPIPADENYIQILRIQASVCEKILSTQTKVDENVLRARNDSRLGSILAAIQEAKKELNLTVVVSSQPQDQ